MSATPNLISFSSTALWLFQFLQVYKMHYYLENIFLFDWENQKIFFATIFAQQLQEGAFKASYFMSVYEDIMKLAHQLKSGLFSTTIFHVHTMGIFAWPFKHKCIDFFFNCDTFLPSF